MAVLTRMPALPCSQVVLNLSAVALLFYWAYYIILEWFAGLTWGLVLGGPMWLTATWFTAAVPHAWAWALGVHLLSWYAQIHLGHIVMEKRKPALLDSFFQVGHSARPRLYCSALAAAASATHAMQPGAEECMSFLGSISLQLACLCGAQCDAWAKLSHCTRCASGTAVQTLTQHAGCMCRVYLLSTWLIQLPVCLQSLVLAPLFVWLEFLFALGYRKQYQAVLKKRIQADIAASKQQKQPLLQKQAGSDGAADAAVTTKA